MIKKEIKEYKRGNSYTYRINMAKQDKMTGEVYIISPSEYNSLKKEIETTNNELKNKKREIERLENKINEIETSSKSIQEMEKIQQQTMKELDQQHYNQLKESYDKFNNEITKYISVNQLQNTALKQILDLGFIDLIRNKHKKIAKDQIKELKEDKKVYELTEKE